MQPGAHGLWSRIRSVGPQRATLRQDAIAGLPGSVASVPDGMASAVLAGVNPIYGLYAAFAGPVGGGLTSSTRLMVITTTSAAALAAGSAIADVPEADRAEALFLLTILAGAAMLAAGILRLGRYTRFVSLSVMLGFLTGIAANIVFGQVQQLAGVDADGSTALARAVDVILHPSAIQLASLLTGLGALALAIVLARTRVGALATVLALAIPTIATLGLEQIQRVEDEGAIPSGVPLPHLPELGLLSFNLVASALAIAAIVLVQGAGVAEIAPNEDGGPSNANRDFMAQGVGNVASGLVRGLPVGGSVGATALNVSAGARSRWSGIFVGLWILVILLLFTGVVAKVAMPTLAAVLIFAAVGSLRIGEIATIFRTGNTSRIALVATFVATLLLPVTTAVGVGVVLSLMLQLNREALDLTVTQIVPGPGRPARRATAPSPLGEPRRDPARRLREPLLRRREDPPGSTPRPGRLHSAGGRAPTARPHGARRHVLRDPGRLRPAARRGRRPPLPQRRRSAALPAASPHEADRPRQGGNLHRDADTRGVEPRRLRGGSALGGGRRRGSPTHPDRVRLRHPPTPQPHE